MADKTIFEKIRDRELKADIVFENDDVLAFTDINPQAPTHVLVIPKEKARSFAEFREKQPEAVGRFLCSVSEVAHRLGLEESGYRIVFNHGADGQQTVEYVHAHILGGRAMSWPPG